jgi:hypothetical protein
MLSRNIGRDDVKRVLVNGEQIEDYPDGFPFPAGLFHGAGRDRTIHVVAALDAKTSVVYVISAYEPDRKHFEPDKKTRRQKP